MSHKNNFEDRREFRGSLLKQLSDAYEYNDLLNKTKATFSGLERIDTRDYPPEAIMLGVSQSRNEKLANFFYRLRLM